MYNAHSIRSLPYSKLVELTLLLNLLNEISYLFKKPAWGILRGVFG